MLNIDQLANRLKKSLTPEQIERLRIALRNIEARHQIKQPTNMMCNPTYVYPDKRQCGPDQIPSKFDYSLPV